MYIANIARIQDPEVKRVMMAMVAEIHRLNDEVARLNKKPRMAIKDGVIHQFEKALQDREKGLIS